MLKYRERDARGRIQVLIITAFRMLAVSLPAGKPLHSPSLSQNTSQRAGDVPRNERCLIRESPKITLHKIAITEHNVIPAPANHMQHTSRGRSQNSALFTVNECEKTSKYYHA